MKRILRIIVIAAVIYGLYYVFIQNRSTKLDEASPLEQTAVTPSATPPAPVPTPEPEPTPPPPAPQRVARKVEIDQAMADKMMKEMSSEEQKAFMEEKKLIMKAESKIMDDSSPMPSESAPVQPSPPALSPSPTPPPTAPPPTPTPSPAPAATPPPPAPPRAMAKIIASGNFQKFLYNVSGKALVIQTEDKKTLRFEDFFTPNGPQLKIYLSTSTDIAGAIDLGEVRATEGNVNYSLNSGIDTKKYNHVLIWCEPFRVLFGFAVLSEA